MRAGPEHICCHCGMHIPMSADICPYCRENPDDPTTNAERARRASSSSKGCGLKFWFWFFIIFFIIGVLASL